MYLEVHNYSKYIVIHLSISTSTCISTSTFKDLKKEVQVQQKLHLRSTAVKYWIYFKIVWRGNISFWGENIPWIKKKKFMTSLLSCYRLEDVTADVCGGDNRTVLARLFMEGDCLVVASSITITEQLAWKLHVYGRNVSLQGLDSVSPTLSSVSAVSAAIRFVCSSHICCGNTDEKFLPLVQARKGKFYEYDFLFFFLFCCFPLLY